MGQHCCYIVRAGKFCKIGYTSDIERRLAQMQTGNAQHMELVCQFPYETESAAREMESWLHNKFIKSRVKGEWFKNHGVITTLRAWGKIEDRGRAARGLKAWA